MTNKKNVTTWDGQMYGNTVQDFSNFFDSASSNIFGSKGTATTEGQTDTTQHGTTGTTGRTAGTSTATGETKNTYGFMEAPEAADVGAYRDWANKQTNQSDPSIKYQAAARNRMARNRYSGPFGAGAGSSAATRQQMLKTEQGGIAEQEGERLVEDADRRRQLQGQSLATLASLGQGRQHLVQTGSSSTQTGVTAGTSDTTGTSDMTGTTKSKQETDTSQSGFSDTKSSGTSGGHMTGSQDVLTAGQQTYKEPWLANLLGGAAGGGGSAGSAAKMASA